MKSALFLSLLAFILLPGRTVQAALLYAVSGVNDLYSISLSGGPATLELSLGDGSSAFNGGLTYNANEGMFYAISNDGFNNSVLNRFSLADGGGVTQLFGLGSPGFFNGLVFNAIDNFFYALSNDGLGTAILNRIDTSGGGTVTPIASVGIAGFMIGGLAFNSLDGLLYGMLGDALGVPRELTAMTTGGAASPLASLGDGSVGYNGGLLFNPDDSFLYAIVNDMFGNSSLHSLQTDGSGDTALFSLGAGGFVNVGLTMVPGEPAPVPEPSSLILFGTGLAGWVALRLRRRITPGETVRPARVIAAFRSKARSAVVRLREPFTGALR